MGRWFSSTRGPREGSTEALRLGPLLRLMCPRKCPFWDVPVLYLLTRKSGAGKVDVFLIVVRCSGVFWKGRKRKRNG